MAKIMQHFVFAELLKDDWIPISSFCLAISFISSPEPKVYGVSLKVKQCSVVVRRRPSSSSSVVHIFEQTYLQDQLADFCQNLSVASLGTGKSA